MDGYKTLLTWQHRTSSACGLTSCYLLPVYRRRCISSFPSGDFVSYVCKNKKCILRAKLFMLFEKSVLSPLRWSPNRTNLAKYTIVIISLIDVIRLCEYPNIFISVGKVVLWILLTNLLDSIEDTEEYFVHISQSKCSYKVVWRVQR